MARGGRHSEAPSDAKSYHGVRLHEALRSHDQGISLGRREPSVRGPSFEQRHENVARGRSPYHPPACSELSARPTSHSRPQTISPFRTSLPAWLILLSATLAPSFPFGHTSLSSETPRPWPAASTGSRSLFWGTPGVATSAPVTVCKNGLKCENNGVCVVSGDKTEACRCPRPISALQPSFFVGARCHIPATMCADTSTFYCANGATCVEIVQGENYTCEGCNSAVAGLHCDAEGVPCGHRGLMCFNGGICPQPANGCLCPPQWNGNENCTALTPGMEASGGETGGGEEEEEYWFVPLLGALGAIVMLSILGGLIYFCYSSQGGASSLHKDSEESLSLQDNERDGASEAGSDTIELPEVSDSQRLQPRDHESSAPIH